MGESRWVSCWIGPAWPAQHTFLPSFGNKALISLWKTTLSPWAPGLANQSHVSSLATVQGWAYAPSQAKNGPLLGFLLELVENRLALILSLSQLRLPGWLDISLVQLCHHLKRACPRLRLKPTLRTQNLDISKADPR